MLTDDEKEFIFYKLGSSGSFKESLYDTFFKADYTNAKILEKAFPDLAVCRRYREEPGYWDDLCRRWNEENDILKMPDSNQDQQTN